MWLVAQNETVCFFPLSSGDILVSAMRLQHRVALEHALREPVVERLHYDEGEVLAHVGESEGRERPHSFGIRRQRGSYGSRPSAEAVHRPCLVTLESVLHGLYLLLHGAPFHLHASVGGLHGSDVSGTGLVGEVESYGDRLGVVVRIHVRGVVHLGP